ncbi:hypothetical protein DSCW_60240 [Desulfosarcina widdelii]|uniref:HTH cro/C1-type domain-containing protein n=1 Tax=Desulfosarcina widdelii TaxID=947919 RepID=A0A5K7ZPQ1_9BACT|nr:helix-turn-helix transcriptional regulator [Desulfosarcina widdelii]BBO78607.1 hypothetical protein DSCW_60240 [Desulfosarcina widdelii]
MTKKTFSERLNYIITKSDVTKKDFARKCGKSEPQLYAYLNGAQLPGTDFYRKLKEEYPQVNLNWLISEEGMPLIEHMNVENSLPIDPAVSFVFEVENELGIELKDKQRQAVLAILRRDVNRCLKEQKSDILNLISSFSEEQLEDQERNSQ